MLPQFLRLCNLPRHILATARFLWANVSRRRCLLGTPPFVSMSREAISDGLLVTPRTLRRHLAELSALGLVRPSTRVIDGRISRGWELIPQDDGDPRAARRKGIPIRVRFEVFKRDGFRCRYCGAHGGDSELCIDHVVALANGGSNEFSNLLTACQACNLGKADTSLDPSLIPEVAS